MSTQLPHVKVSIYPCTVQGHTAPASIINALSYCDSQKDIDIIVVTRGGGSNEDLACFNDEKLIRSIANTHTPVITAIGHETDITLCDFSSDKRCATPSATVAVLAQPYQEFKQNIHYKLSYLSKIVTEKIHAQKNTFYQSTLALSQKMSHRYKHQKQQLETQKRLLESINPVKKLSQGYSQCLDKKNTPITSIHDVTINDPITIQLKNGTLMATVTGKDPS